MMVASSNAQAKNISTQEVKARTIHNAGGVRVQGFKNELLRPGPELRPRSRPPGSQYGVSLQGFKNELLRPGQELRPRSRHRGSQYGVSLVVQHARCPVDAR